MNSIVGSGRDTSGVEPCDGNTVVSRDGTSVAVAMVVGFSVVCGVGNVVGDGAMVSTLDGIGVAAVEIVGYEVVVSDGCLVLLVGFGVESPIEIVGYGVAGSDGCSVLLVGFAVESAVEIVGYGVAGSDGCSVYLVGFAVASEGATVGYGVPVSDGCLVLLVGFGVASEVGSAAGVTVESDRAGMPVGVSGSTLGSAVVSGEGASTVPGLPLGLLRLTVGDPVLEEGPGFPVVPVSPPVKLVGAMVNCRSGKTAFGVDASSGREASTIFSSGLGCASSSSSSGSSSDVSVTLFSVHIEVVTYDTGTRVSVAA